MKTEFKDWARERSLCDITGHDLEKLEKLSGREKQQLLRNIELYRRACEINAAEIQTHLTRHNLFANLKSFAGTIIRGGAIGVSAAGIVNTIAPGLFPTTLGYIAGALKGTSTLRLCAKLGLVTISVFAPPVISQGAILVCGAVIGVLGYWVFCVCCKLLHKVFGNSKCRLDA